MDHLLIDFLEQLKAAARYSRLDPRGSGYVGLVILQSRNDSLLQLVIDFDEKLHETGVEKLCCEYQFNNLNGVICSWSYIFWAPETKPKYATERTGATEKMGFNGTPEACAYFLAPFNNPNFKPPADALQLSS